MKPEEATEEEIKLDPRANNPRTSRLEKILAYIDRVTKWKPISYLLQKAERYSDLQLSDASGAMTYYLAMALFPFAIFLTTVLAWVGKGLDIAKNLATINTLIPQPVLDFLLPIIREITTNYHLSLLSVSALSILWASSKGFDTFLFHMDRTYDKAPKAFLLKKLLGLLFILLLTAVIILLLISVGFGALLLDKLAEWTELPIFRGYFLRSARLLLPFLFIAFIFSLLYQGFSRREAPFRYAVYSASIPTITWLVLSLGLSWYIERFTKYDLIYGSITGLVLLLFWLYLLVQTVFLGAFIHSEMILAYRAKMSTKAQKQGGEGETSEPVSLSSGAKVPDPLQEEKKFNDSASPKEKGSESEDSEPWCTSRDSNPGPTD